MISQCIRYLAIAFTIGAVDAQCYERVEEWIQHHEDLQIVKALLATNCSQLVNSTIPGDSQNMTIFAPIDSAWKSSFQINNPESIRNVTFRDDMMTVSKCYNYFSSHNRTKVPMEELSGCLPWLALYHASPERYDELFNSTLNETTVTVIPSYLDLSNSTNPTFNISQVLVANSTTNGTVLQGGGNNTANIVNTYYAKNGRIYLIDNVLFPPLPLNNTLQSLNSTVSVDSNFLDQNITVFAPFEEAFGAEPSQNISYVVPEIIYLNHTMAGSLNSSTIDGTPLFVHAENNGTILVGNTTVARANIPLVNGVLHLIDSTIGTFNMSSSYQARKLRQNWHQWQRVAFAN